MKRDARIGLAVVLVLGLAVTLLIGRALVDRGGETADADGEVAGGPAQYSADAAHVDGAPTANIATPPNAPIIEGAEPAALSPRDNPAVRQFVDDQTRRLGVENSPVNPVPPPPAASKAPAVEAPVNGPTRPIAGPAAPEAPKNDHSLLLDHEQSGPAPAADAQPPTDGYGYTVVAGDNPWKISSKVYGDGKYTQKIVDANPNLNAAKMKAGTVIRIPVIPNKTVLLKLATLAEALKAPAGGGAIAAKENKKAEPVAASTNAKAPEGAAGGEVTTHKIEAGETLGAIAQKYYGASGPKSTGRIVAANKGLDPAKLKIGHEIQIPAKK